jgi:prepilin-type N-terminal cleavage/methylation domain-containing protein
LTAAKLLPQAGLGITGEFMITHSKKYARGFTLVEVLIAMMITGMLMAAIASAIHASSINYSTNESIFKSMNIGRLTLLRITAELRTAQAVAVSEASNQCSIITTDGDDITYLYNDAEEILYLVTNDDLTDADYVLCKNVTDVTFTRTTYASDPGIVKDVMISITTNVGDVSQTLSSAAVLRKNLP